MDRLAARADAISDGQRAAPGFRRHLAADGSEQDLGSA